MRVSEESTQKEHDSVSFLPILRKKSPVAIQVICDVTAGAWGKKF